MSLGKRLLGYVSAPFVGARNEPGVHWNGIDYSSASDRNDWNNHMEPRAKSLPIVPWGQTTDVYGSLSDREKGTYNLIPGRALSAQTRLKNMTWELPSAVWTQNPDGAPYIVRVPGLPGQVINLPTQNAFTTQPEFLQPITNLQIQNDMNWLQQFRAAIFGQAFSQQTQQQSETMFPSVFGNGNITVNLNGQ